ncbi:MAG: RDD family protein [Fimbriimonadaceae bacterium]|nr:RDD family protein [Alphaproteobacteria bacterium]
MSHVNAESAPTYDEAPELFEGVLSRRIIAFFIDATIILALTTLAYVFTFFLGILTLGLAWLIFGAVFPVVALWYTGATLSSVHSATIGMRSVGIEMRTWNGEPMTFLLGVVHALVFWLSFVGLTPLVAVVGLLNPRGRLLHDFILGTYVINSDV